MRSFITILFLACFTTFATAQKTNYQLSSHILDVSRGKPAAGVTVKLEQYQEASQSWKYLDEKVTDSNGRIGDFLPGNQAEMGIYRLTYYTYEYFKKKQTESFYPFIEVVFRIKDKSHYHVPITLSAYGYSTYRGS